MNQGLYHAISAMDAAERRLQAVAHNLANVSTNAFKRRGTSFGSIVAAARPQGELRVLQARERVDFSQGAIQETGNPLDLALFGAGFFAVELEDGEAYTRDGSFRLDEQGELVTQDGFPLAFESRLGAIDPRGGPIAVDGEGSVRQGAVEVGRLKLIDFADPNRLQLDPRGYWRAPRGLSAVAYTAQVRQGALEGANVDPIGEIIALIEVQRSFESAARAVSNISESYQRLNQRSQ